MKKTFPLLIAAFAMLLTVFGLGLPGTASAQVADGTYKLQYEMKEAGSENTSIADGYFSKPATLTVKNGVQYLQMTVTGSHYIESLSAPSGPVQTVSEDTQNHVRVVRFRVDGDLSKPLPMEMHIIVPDLYDMTHTARAVFNVSGLKQAPKAEKKEEKKTTNKTTAPKKKAETKTETKPKAKPKAENNVKKEAAESSKAQKSTQEKKDTKKDEAPDSSVKKENTEKAEKAKKAKEAKEAAEKEESDETDESENAEEHQEEADSEDDETASSSVETDAKVEDSQKEGSSSVLWITLAVVIIAGFGLGIFLNKRRKNT